MVTIILVEVTKEFGIAGFVKYNEETLETACNIFWLMVGNETLPWNGLTLLKAAAGQSDSRCHTGLSLSSTERVGQSGWVYNLSHTLYTLSSSLKSAKWLYIS